MKGRAQSLDQIFNNFEPGNQVRKPSLKLGAPVSVWVPREYKSRYDKLQEETHFQFSKMLRELIMAAIEAAESKTAPT